ncbi:putative RNA-directed DNA polymerase [Tanacetum coccineum]
MGMFGIANMANAHVKWGKVVMICGEVVFVLFCRVWRDFGDDEQWWGLEFGGKQRYKRSVYNRGVNVKSGEMFEVSLVSENHIVIMAIGDASGSVEMINNLNVGNPLYLQTNDNTGLAIINVKLVGAENYKMCATAMKIALKGKNKIGFIDGTCVKQESSDVLSQQWERCNAIVLETYDKMDGSVVFNLMHKINNMKQGDLSVSDYYHKLNSLWREFYILTILPAYVCEGRIVCTCDAKSGSVKHTQLIRLMQFLMGLNDVYQPIRSTILAKDPLPNVKDAFYVVSREESHRGLHSGGSGTNKSQPVTFVVMTNNNTNNFNRNVNTNNNNKSVNRGPNPNLICTNCRLISHTMERCYDIIRYHAGFKRNLNLSKQSRNNNKRFNDNCEVNPSVPSTSGIKSNFSNNNISFKLPNFYNNNVFFNLNFEKFFNAKSKSEMFNVSLGWIIDSGANQHMTDSTKDMFNVVDISSIMLIVGHPNGTLSKITPIGSLILTSGIVLFDVLVIPEYSFGLLSVNKMIKDSKFFVGFDEHKCYIQEKLWGLAAKQTREPFLLSDHKSKSVGDMIHCGVWGPYRVVSKDGFRFFLTIVDDFSRAVWVYLLKSKAEVGEYVESSIKLIFTQFGKKVKIVRSDNGTEFINNKLSGLFNYLGIIHQTSCAYTPQQNGIVKRKHRHLLNVARSLMSESPYDEEGDTSNEDGNIGVTSDDYGNIVEDEVADVAIQIEENVTSEGNGTSPVLRRSIRQKVMPIKFNDYVVNSHVKYGLEKYVSYVNLSKRYFCFSTTLNKSVEPKTFHEASQNPKWIEAMNLEMEALHINNTYILADLPPGRKAIGCKWIWKIKYKSSGEINRYKARLVAKGFSQRDGIDYEETFSPVVKMVIVSKNNIFIAILVYVDDIVITGNNEYEIDKFKKFLSSKFMNKDLGLLKYFLGIEVLENKNEFENDKFSPNMTEYRKIVGKLIYLSITRHDISYVAHCLSQNMHAPLQSHFTVALRVLRYLKNAPVRRKQATISRSSAKSEYRCLASTTCKLIWVVKILKDLEVDGLLPTHLYCDSKKVTSSLIKVLKVASANNVADIFTKGLSVAHHAEFFKRLRLVDMFKP